MEGRGGRSERERKRERERAVTAGSTTAEAQFFALRVEIDRSGADGGRRGARERRGVPGIHGAVYARDGLVTRTITRRSFLSR